MSRDTMSLSPTHPRKRGCDMCCPWLVLIVAVIIGFIIGVFGILFVIEITDQGRNTNNPF